MGMGMAPARNTPTVASRRDCAVAAEQHVEAANGDAEATSDGQEARRSRTVKTSSKRLPFMRASSRRVMHWLDERE